MLVFIPLLSFLIFEFVYSAKDLNDNCEKWAAVDEECNKNPRYMWDACQKSCMTLAENDHKSCGEWASTGECSKNRGYMQIHCPQACSFAVSWSPWVRSKLDIVPIKDYFEVEDSCGLRQDVFGAAHTVHTRLSVFLSGSGVEGLTDSAPSEFNGMAGLAEAVLYSARLYRSILESAESEAGLAIDVLVQEIDDILATYDGDAIMRNMHNWLKALDKAADVVYEIAGHNKLSAESSCLAFGASMDEIAARFHPHYEALLAAPPSSPSPATVALSNGVDMPTVGLGTWQLQGVDCIHAVTEALSAGYRHFDSAQAYHNEWDVGVATARAIAANLVSRQELFLATKISDESHAGYDNVKALVKEQLANLQTDYIDLYMLHSPISNNVLQADTWRALEELVDEGVIRALGVSNFNGNELEKLYKSVRIKPTVVQNKFDIYHVGKQMDSQGDDLEAVCRRLGVKMVAYSPLSAYPFAMLPTFDPIVQFVAARNGMTPAQAVLRWALQRGALVIPRSTNPARLRENMAVVGMAPFSAADFALLSSITHLTASAMYVATS